MTLRALLTRQAQLRRQLDSPARGRGPCCRGERRERCICGQWRRRLSAARRHHACASAAGAPTFWEIFHGEHLVLVDRQLRIRGYFPATPEGLDRLMEAIGQVINSA